MINFYILILLIGLLFQICSLSEITNRLKILKPLVFPALIWYFFENKTSELINFNDLQKNIIYGITISFTLGSIFSFREKNKKNIDLIIFSYFLLAISLTIESNLFFIFIKFELLTILGAILIVIENKVFDYENFKSIALRYFITHCFAGVLLLIGIGYLSNSYSTFNIYELQIQFLTTGHYFIIAALLINSAMPLFSFWLVQGYSATRFSTSFIMFPVVTKISIFFIFIICAQAQNLEFLKIIGIITMIYGSIITLFETDIRKFLAYATISHSGFFLIFISQFTNLPFSESSKVCNSLIFSSIISQNILLSIFFTITQNAKSYFFLDIEKNIKKYKALFLLTIIGNAIFIGLPYTLSFPSKTLVFEKIQYPLAYLTYFTIVVNIQSHLFILPYKIFKNKEITFSTNSFSSIDYIKNLFTTAIPITLSIFLTKKYEISFDQINKYLQFLISSCATFIVFYKIIPKNRGIVVDTYLAFFYLRKALNIFFIKCKNLGKYATQEIEVIYYKLIESNKKLSIINIYNATILSIFFYLTFFIINYFSYSQ